jgi:hypothetical protein
MVQRNGTKRLRVVLLVFGVWMAMVHGAAAATDSVTDAAEMFKLAKQYAEGAWRVVCAVVRVVRGLP